MKFKWQIILLLSLLLIALFFLLISQKALNFNSRTQPKSAIINETHGKKKILKEEIPEAQNTKSKPNSQSTKETNNKKLPTTLSVYEEISKASSELQNFVKDHILENEGESSNLPLRVIDCDWNEVPCQEIKYCHVKYLFKYEGGFQTVGNNLMSSGKMKDLEINDNSLSLPDIKRGLYHLYIKAENYPIQYLQVLKHDDHYLAQLNTGNFFTVNFKGHIGGITSLNYQISTKIHHRKDSTLIFKSLSPKETNEHLLQNQEYLVQFPQMLPNQNRFEFNKERSIEVNLNDYEMYHLYFDQYKSEICKELQTNENDFKDQFIYSFIVKKNYIEEIVAFFYCAGFYTYFNETTNELKLNKIIKNKRINLSIKDQYGKDITNLIQFVNTKIPAKTEKENNNLIQNSYTSFILQPIPEQHKHRFSVENELEYGETRTTHFIELNENQLENRKISITYFIDLYNQLTVEHEVDQSTKIIETRLNLPSEYYITIKLNNYVESHGGNEAEIYTNHFTSRLDQTYKIKEKSFTILHNDKIEAASQYAYNQAQSEKNEPIKHIGHDLNLSLKIEGYENESITKPSDEIEINLKKVPRFYGQVVNQYKKPFSNKTILIDFSYFMKYSEYEITSNEEGNFSFFSPNQKFKVNTGHNKNFSNNDFALSSKSDPIIIEEFDFTNQSIISETGDPIKNAIVVFTERKRQKNSTFYTIKNPSRESSALAYFYDATTITYTDEKGLPFLLNTPDTTIEAFHISHMGIKTQRHDGTPNSELILETNHKPKYIFRSPQSQSLFKNTTFLANIRHTLKLRSTLNAFQNIQNFLEVKPSDSNEVGLYTETINQETGTHQLLLYLPFIDKKIDFLDAENGDEITCEIKAEDRSICRNSFVFKENTGYTYNSIFDVGYKEMHSENKKLILLFSNEKKGIQKTFMFNLLEVPNKLAVNFDEIKKSITVNNQSLKENTKESSFSNPFVDPIFIGYSKENNHSRELNTQSKQQKSNSSETEKKYYLDSEHSQYSGPIIIWHPNCNLQKIDYINEIKNDQRVDLSEGGKVIINNKSSDSQNRLTFHYYNDEIKQFLACNIHINENGQETQTTLTEGCWFYNWDNISNIIEVHKNQALIIELPEKINSDSLLNYKLIKEGNPITLSHRFSSLHSHIYNELISDGGTISKSTNSLSKLIYTLKNINYEVPINLKRLSVDFEIDLDKPFITLNGALMYKITPHQPTSCISETQRIHLSLLDTNQPLYLIKNDENNLYSLQKFATTQDCIDRANTNENSIQEIKIKLNGLNLHYSYLITKDSYIIPIRSYSKTPFQINTLKFETFHLYIRTEEGPILIKDIQTSSNELSQSNIHKNSTFEAEIVTKKGSLALFNDNLGVYMPSHLQIILGSFQKNDSIPHSILNLGSIIKLKCHQVPYGKYHFTLYDPSKESLSHSESFEVNEATTKIKLKIK